MQTRSLIQFGNLYRILSPFEGNETAWNFVSDDQSEVVVNYFVVLAQPAAAIRTLRLKGLNPDFQYKNIDTGEIFGGDELMNVGITTPWIKKDFVSSLWRVEKI